MNLNEVLQELEAMGNPQTKSILTKHGAQEPFFGVKVGDLKKIVKKVKKDHALSLALYETGNGDAMYLASLIADEKQITKEHLQRWVQGAHWYMLSEYAVAWIAAESRFGWELGLEWIDSEKEMIATAGWSTLSSYASIKKDEDLDIEVYRSLLDRVEGTLHDSPNRVRYVMNGFVISVGAYIEALTEHALTVGENLGKVHVDMGGTACKVPVATAYIQKIIDKGRIGKKRKMARC
ncbi:MAG: DNA alkylation repair protein [Bacteroidota bacterium]